MERLSAADLTALCRCVGDVYAHADLDSFPGHVLGAVGRLVPHNYLAFSEVNLARRRLVEVMSPADAHRRDLLPALESHMPEHALITRYRRTRDGRAYKLSDFLSRAEFLRLGLYNEVYRHYGVEDQMAVALPAPRELMVTLVLSRPRRTFGERDRLVLNLLRPHLIQAYRNAEAVTELKAELAGSRLGLEATRQAVVALGPGGRVRWLTPAARTILEEFFASWRRRPLRLPEELSGWLSLGNAGAGDGSADADDAPAAREPFVAEYNGRRLVARLVSSPTVEEWLLVLRVAGNWGGEGGARETDPTHHVPRLPPRVRRVLDRLVLGDSEKEVAARLGLSRHTVHQYVKLLYRRLDVSSRGELMARFVAGARLDQSKG